MDTEISVSNMALAGIGTRSRITSLDPGIDDSQEAMYCNLFFSDVRRWLLRAANWNFATKWATPLLWKALPGTPENSTPAISSEWLPQYPNPPWRYSYLQPDDYLRGQRIRGQYVGTFGDVPIFSGANFMEFYQGNSFARFEIGQDAFAPDGTYSGSGFRLTVPLAVSPVSGGGGYTQGDVLTIPGNSFNIPATLIVSSVSSGVITFANIVSGGFFKTAPTNPVSPIGGTGFGATFNLTFSPLPIEMAVILTDVQKPLLKYTYDNYSVSSWDSMFLMAMTDALSGRLAIPLTGDKSLANLKFTLANDTILQARVADGNEGLTINDHIPDWLSVRGVGGNNYLDSFTYPYGPLFPLT